MGQETANTIDELNPLWPDDDTDSIGIISAHQRTTKGAIQGTFPNIVKTDANAEELNILAGALVSTPQVNSMSGYDLEKGSIDARLTELENTLPIIDWIELRVNGTNNYSSAQRHVQVRRILCDWEGGRREVVGGVKEHEEYNCTAIGDVDQSFVDNNNGIQFSGNYDWVGVLRVDGCNPIATDTLYVQIHSTNDSSAALGVSLTARIKWRFGDGAGDIVTVGYKGHFQEGNVEWEIPLSRS